MSKEIKKLPKEVKECKCACHENLLKKSYEHDLKCCEEMNGYLTNKVSKEDKLVSRAGGREQSRHPQAIKEDSSPIPPVKVPKDWVEELAITTALSLEGNSTRNSRIDTIKYSLKEATQTC